MSCRRWIPSSTLLSFLLFGKVLAQNPAWPGERLQVNTGRETQRLLPQRWSESQTSRVPQHWARGSDRTQWGNVHVSGLAQFCCTQRYPARSAGVSETDRLQTGCSDVNLLLMCSGGWEADATIEAASLVPVLGQPLLCRACSQLLCQAGFLPFTLRRVAVLLDFQETLLK